MQKRKKYLAALVVLSLFTGALPVFAEDLPSFYDWRLITPTARNSDPTDNIIGPVRNQGVYGTCWVFDSVSSLESSFNKQVIDAGQPSPHKDFSERYLAWLTYALPTDGKGTDGYSNSLMLLPKPDTSGNSNIFFQGGLECDLVSTLVRYGIASEEEYPYDSNWKSGVDMGGVNRTSASSGAALHDMYNLAQFTKDGIGLCYLKNNVDYYKTMVKNLGAILVDYNAYQPNYDTYNYRKYRPNHGVAIVGWDDDYVLRDPYGNALKDENGNELKGAWIVRNNWGSETAGTGYKGTGDGYLHISYKDSSLQDGVFLAAETDSGRYTAITTNSPMGGFYSLAYANVSPLTATGNYTFSHKLTSGSSQMLKATGFYVPEDAMSYTVSVSLKGSTPADTKAIYTQSGTFGQDGTSAYKGYRTVDFKKFVYVPNGQNYFITVKVQGQDGVTYQIPSCVNLSNIYSLAATNNVTLTDGVSYLFDATTQTWVDTKNMMASQNVTNFSVPLYALGKNSNEANGGDFTVVSLNDNGAGGSEIYLGKKDEAYNTDPLNPNRTTLSNMTVELTKDLTDSVYGGRISGEGSVTKTGDGTFALSGSNTYSGGTNVSAGTFALTGSLQSAVNVASGATFTGNGTVNGNVTNSGILAPGLTSAARNLYSAAGGSSVTYAQSSVGTLTINGNLNSTGNIEVAMDSQKNNSKLVVSGSTTLTGSKLVVTGTHNPKLDTYYTYLTSQNGITGNVTPTNLSDLVGMHVKVEGNNAMFEGYQVKSVGDNISGTTPAEQSVSKALEGDGASLGKTDPSSEAASAFNDVLYQTASEATTFVKETTGEARGQLLGQSPLSSLTTETIYSRMSNIALGGSLTVRPKVAGLTGDTPTIETSIPVSLDAKNNLWFKLFKGYETYNAANGNVADLKNQSFGGAVGYDKALNLTTRVGGLFSYGKTHYSMDNITGDSHDWRLGTYVDHHNGNWDYQGLLTYGHNNYDMDRYTSWERSTVNSDYKAKIWDAEAKAKYLIPSTQKKTWQVEPYGKVMYTHSTQDAYSETGNSYFKQNLDKVVNNSWRAEVGVGLKRNIGKNGGWDVSVGYKRVLSGANPELNGTFAYGVNQFTISTDNDKNYLTYNIGVHGKLGGKWTGAAELSGEKSIHNHKEIISVSAKYSF
jgi:autotransporter-associated beta strand protein